MDTNEQLRIIGSSAGCISFKERIEHLLEDTSYCREY